MNLRVQKRLTAEVMKCSPKRVKFDEERLEDIKESITRRDLVSLVNDGAISIIQKKGSSKARARKKRVQKAKGRQKGHGSRKGKANARESAKRIWINRIRKQKELLKKLRDKKIITTRAYHKMYALAKGGFFRSVGHIKGYIEEHNLAKKD